MDDIKTTLEKRGKRYGVFKSQAEITQAFKELMYLQGTNDISVDKREALEMIFSKIARILNGDPNYKDSWVDIAGYATLISDTLKDE